MRIPPALLLIVLALGAIGCAPRPALDVGPAPGGVAFPDHTAAQVLAEAEAVAARDSLLAFASQARLVIRSPRQNADATATIRQRGADTLWASVRGPLNLEVARALFTPDSFRVHDRFRNQLLVGPAEAAQRLFPGPVGPEEVFRTLTGTLTPDPGVRWIVNAGTVDGQQAYWLTAPDARARMALSPATWRVLRYERLGPDGRVVDARRFSDFAPVDGRVLPQTIVLNNPAEALEVTIEHRRLTLNPSPLEFPFTPGTARRVPFEPGVDPFALPAE